MEWELWGGAEFNISEVGGLTQVYRRSVMSFFFEGGGGGGELASFSTHHTITLHPHSILPDTLTGPLNLKLSIPTYLTLIPILILGGICACSHPLTPSPCHTLTQVVEILGEEEEGWWRGRINGRDGVFPSNFVESIEQSDSTASSDPNGMRQNI